MSDVKETGERIRRLRKEKGWTQTDLGNRIGVQNSAIAKYENGRVPNLKRSTIKALADALGVNPSYLMGLDEGVEYASAYRTTLDLMRDDTIVELQKICADLDDRSKERLLAYAEGLAAAANNEEVSK